MPDTQAVGQEDRGLVACHRVRELTNTLVLKFSGGKDSVAMWLRCREIFPRIIPVYQYWCPDLAFVERTLVMYEAFFGQTILRVPHPNFLNFQASGAFQYPHRARVIAAYNLDFVSYDDIMEFVCDDLGLSSPWLAIGVKSWDSPLRANVIKKYGAWSPGRQFVYPVADLRHADVYAMIHAAGCPLSEDYAVFGRSFDGLQYRYLAGIREHYPDDYQRLKTWFPLVDVECMRAEAYATEKGTVAGLRN